MDKRVYILLGLIVVVILGGVLFYFKNGSLENDNGVIQKTTSSEISEKVASSNQGNLNIQNETATEHNGSVEYEYYTMEEIQKHNSRESCWTVIRGDVYDLTAWIDKHPGGADKILKLCGKDGTQAFEKKHGGQEKPEKALEQFEIGKLKQ